jgi:heat shock protein HslJ
MKRLIAALTLSLAACVPAMATEIGGDWHLVGLEGQRAPAPLSITFTSDGKVSGKAPCNRFFGSYSGPLPAVVLSALGSTRMACDALDVEAAYLESLAAVQRAEFAENRLFLIGPEGRILEFSRDPDEVTCLSCGDLP